jgi:hypothetical protein
MKDIKQHKAQRKSQCGCLSFASVVSMRKQLHLNMLGMRKATSVCSRELVEEVEETE